MMMGCVIVVILHVPPSQKWSSSYSSCCPPTPKRQFETLDYSTSKAEAFATYAATERKPSLESFVYLAALPRPPLPLPAAPAAVSFDVCISSPMYLRDVSLWWDM
jgi:hypothetical protein